MITENQILLMILDISIKKDNKSLMDILMVMLSMKDLQMKFKLLLMVILMSVLSMMNHYMILEPVGFQFKKNF